MNHETPLLPRSPNLGLCPKLGDLGMAQKPRFPWQKSGSTVGCNAMPFSDPCVPGIVPLNIPLLAGEIQVCSLQFPIYLDLPVIKTSGSGGESLMIDLLKAGKLHCHSRFPDAISPCLCLKSICICWLESSEILNEFLHLPLTKMDVSENGVPSGELT